jgi:hypothetical protein
VSTKNKLRELNRKQDDQLLKLSSLEASSSEIHKTLSAISVTIGKQEENLKEHMRRTELLETSMQVVNRHVTVVEGIGSIMKWFAAIAAGLVAITKFFKIW